MHYIVAVVSILLGAVAQYFFKVGVTVVSQKANGMGEIIKMGMINLHLWSGLACYGVSLLMWFYVLSHMELSRAFPLVSIAYVFTLLMGYFFLNEPLTVYKIIGISLIIGGVVFVAK